jgi:hypothetical protein
MVKEHYLQNVSCLHSMMISVQNYGIMMDERRKRKEIRSSLQYLIDWFDIIVKGKKFNREAVELFHSTPKPEWMKTPSSMTVIKSSDQKIHSRIFSCQRSLFQFLEVNISLNFISLISIGSSDAGRAEISVPHVF